MEAWMLFDEAAKVATGFAVISFLKRLWGARVTEKCLIEKCPNGAAAQNRRGLCLVCYGKAKKRVESGQATWEKLVELRLCRDIRDPFDSAYERAMEDRSSIPNNIQKLRDEYGSEHNPKIHGE